jgi:hypothetical protein
MALQIGMMGGLGIGLGLLMAIVGIVVGALLLWLTAKIFKLSDKSFMTPLIIAAIAGAVGFVLGLIPFINRVSWLVVIILAIWLIRSRYGLGWGKSILVWLVYFVLSLVVMFVIGMIFLGGGMMAMPGGA